MAAGIFSLSIVTHVGVCCVRETTMCMSFKEQKVLGQDMEDDEHGRDGVSKRTRLMCVRFMV